MSMGDLVNRKKVFEHISKAADSIGEIALDSIPGGAVIKAIWNYGSELQTSRSLKFLEDFQRILEEKLGRNFYDHELQNKDFHDLFYVIMQEVQKTSSEEKLKRFRSLLLNQAVMPEKDSLNLKFVNILSRLNDIQLIIIERMRDRVSSYRVDFVRLVAWNDPATNDGYAPRIDSNNIPIKIADNIIYTKSTEIDFYVSELVSLGVLEMKLKQNSSIEHDYATLGDSNSKEVYSIEVQHRITEVGIHFLKHIEQ